MKLALIILGILGIALLAWAALGFYISIVGWEDPPPPAGLLDDIWWSAVREGLLGASLLLVAVVALKRRKARELMLGGLNDR